MYRVTATRTGNERRGGSQESGRGMAAVAVRRRATLGPITAHYAVVWGPVALPRVPCLGVTAPCRSGPAGTNSVGTPFVEKRGGGRRGKKERARKARRGNFEPSHFPRPRRALRGPRYRRLLGDRGGPAGGGEEGADAVRRGRAVVADPAARCAAAAASDTRRRPICRH